MRQLLQRLDSGETYLDEAPTPWPAAGQILVGSRASLISAGTERMLLDFGRAGLLAKARQQPERVRQVLTRMQTEGVTSTLDAVRTRLAQPMNLGYCQAGVVLQCGEGVHEFAPGDRVVTNGSHAEQVTVGRRLAARIPDGVEFEEAAFTPLAAIGLQGIRLARPQIGETVVVYGLGLIGLLCVQILRGAGCKVLGVDLNPDRLQLAALFGAETIDGGATDVAAAVHAATGGVGADAALLTLASSAHEPVHQAARSLRKRGRIILIGVSGLHLRREDFYEKELTFQVSCSYGPGRYDPTYEIEGRDYPLPWVRWTEQRNFEAVLHLMETGALDVAPLITARVPFAEAPRAYDLLADRDTLGVVFEYAPEQTAERTHTIVRPRAIPPTPGRPSVAVIGAGNFAVRTFIPRLASRPLHLHTLASRSGGDASTAAARFGFRRVSTDIEAVLRDPEIDAVFILTRHDSHAALAEAALAAGKHVFVEKPLALQPDDARRVVERAAATGAHLLVGFNRRFSPLAREVAEAVAGRAGPLAILMTIHAGPIPRPHWVHDAEVGGGRIVGEACHWIDLARFWTGSPLVGQRTLPARSPDGSPIDDRALIHLDFADGSVASLHYLAAGSPHHPKEQLTCVFDDRTLAIDNWRRVKEWSGPSLRLPLPTRPAKGHDEEIDAFLAAIADGGPPPIPLDELLEVSLAAIEAGREARGVRDHG